MADTIEGFEMGYYIVFRRLHRGFAIYHDLVKEYRKCHLNDVIGEYCLGDNLGEKYWKEREEQGLNADLQWLCDAMERKEFDLIFLTDDFAVFKRRNWIKQLISKVI